MSDDQFLESDPEGFGEARECDPQDVEDVEIGELDWYPSWEGPELPQEGGHVH